MTISQLLSPVLSKSLIILFISVLLSACSSGESVTGDSGENITGDTGVGATPQGITHGIALSWIAPVEREDGTPISMAEIAGYRVYYGTSQGDYPNEVDIADSSTMQVALSNLVSGTYYIVVTSYDVDGLESGFSQVLTTSI